MMTLKEELEILRGEPIQVFDGDPMDIPCIETSDAEKLCKHPLVSVHMITYNHEPYIRQAIEGVMMQQTDFELELIIGEDCSQDKTREICFEYQKKYPDKIRVLWWHENVSKLGGNSRRVFARCRGEFIAFCEGDDYWIDPLKLQKQVDLIRKTNAVMCVANSEWHYSNGEVRPSIYKSGNQILQLEDVLKHYFHTTTYLINRSVFKKCQKKYAHDFICWYDCVVIAGMATMGTIVLLPDIVSVYNWTGTGISGDEGTLRRKRMFAVQHVQFARCSIRRIADAYYKSLSFLFLGMYSLNGSNGDPYPRKDRKSLTKIIRSIARSRDGRWGELRMLIRCYRRLFKAWLSAYCPQTMRVMRRFKRIWLPKS